MDKRPALLLIGLQKDHFPRGPHPVEGIEAAAAGALQPAGALAA